MAKKRTLKKLKFCFEDTLIMKGKKQIPNLQHKPSEFFQSHKKVAEVLLQSLEENDAGAFLEILDTYLRVNRTKVAKAAKISRTTVQNALSKNGNPTIRTIAKIVHRAVA
jgi:DNA-binding phage protein